MVVSQTCHAMSLGLAVGIQETASVGRVDGLSKALSLAHSSGTHRGRRLYWLRPLLGDRWLTYRTW